MKYQKHNWDRMWTEQNRATTVRSVEIIGISTTHSHNSIISFSPLSLAHFRKFRQKIKRRENMVLEHLRNNSTLSVFVYKIKNLIIFVFATYLEMNDEIQNVWCSRRNQRVEPQIAELDSRAAQTWMKFRIVRTMWLSVGSKQTERISIFVFLVFFTFIFCVCSRLVAHLHKHTQHSNMDMEQNSR